MENSGFLIDIPDDADELGFFSHFINDEVLDNLVFEMNEYASWYIEKLTNTGKLAPKSRFRLWPEDCIDKVKIKKFIALTFYFGLMKKDNVKSYWSVNSVNSFILFEEFKKCKCSTFWKKLFSTIL